MFSLYSLLLLQGKIGALGEGPKEILLAMSQVLVAYFRQCHMSNLERLYQMSLYFVANATCH